MWFGKSEMEENTYLLDKSKFSIDERFGTCLKWYIKKACFYRSIYYTFAMISTVCPIIVTALNSVQVTVEDFNTIRTILIVLSMLASISTITMTTFRVQDKWTKYRMAAEALKRKRSLFLGKDIYDDNSEAYLFLKELEEYMARENLEWRKDNTAVEDERTSTVKKEKKEDTQDDRKGDSGNTAQKADPGVPVKK